MAPTRRTHAAIVAVTLASLALMSGCAARPSDNAAATTAPNPPVTAAPTVTGTPPVAEGTPSTSRSKSAAEITVRGIVQDGVEGGCLLLEVDSGPPYLLLGGDRNVLKAGARLEVVGIPQPEVVSTCQQGTPLQVTSAEPI